MFDELGVSEAGDWSVGPLGVQGFWICTETGTIGECRWMLGGGRDTKTLSRCVSDLNYVFLFLLH